MNRVKLPEVCELIMGQSPDSTSYNKSKEGLPFYQGNANFGPKYPTPTVWCSLPKKIARNNDILISVRAPIGDLNFANEECCIGRGLAALRIKDNSKYSKEYLFAFLKSIARELQRKGTGSTFTAIGKTVLEDLEINVPSLPEQQKIAAHLDSIQSAIDNKKQQLQQLDELVKSRFVEMFGDPIANEMNWTKKIMTDVCPIKEYDFNPSENEWILNLDMIESNTGTILEKVISPLKEIGNSTIKFSQNHVLYSKLRPYLNKVVLPDDYGFATSELVPFLPGEEINRIYFATFLRSAPFVELINSKSGGAKMPRASMDFLRKFEIPVPPIELQNTFAEYVQKIDSAKSIIKTQLVDLQELLDSKMDEYFGE